MLVFLSVDLSSGRLIYFNICGDLLRFNLCGRICSCSDIVSRSWVGGSYSISCFLLHVAGFIVYVLAVCKSCYKSLPGDSLTRDGLLSCDSTLAGGTIAYLVSFGALMCIHLRNFIAGFRYP